MVHVSQVLGEYKRQIDDSSISVLFYISKKRLSTLMERDLFFLTDVKNDCDLLSDFQL